MFAELVEVRAAAVEHTRIARELHQRRKGLMMELLARGYSQSDLAREMGVTRQAVQKMLTLG